MIVNTKSVMHRRPLRFESYGDLLIEAEMLSESEVAMLGNWTVGQILFHLALSMHAAIDGPVVEAPSWRRWLVRLFYQQRLLSGPMPAGVWMPREAAEVLSPPPVTASEGFIALRDAVERLSLETERARHPLLGDLSLDEWDRFHLRHAELHMSFAVPLGVPMLV